MFKPSLLRNSIRSAFFIGATSLVSTMAFAQEAEEMTAAEDVEKVSVTGSRIARAELESAAPVFTVSAEDFAKAGTPDLASFLAEIPAISSSDTLVGNRGSNGAAGLSSANLRSLGASRTLTLVNGIRHVAGAAGSSQVDLSTIPNALVERVEIITGGASAVYGSDAVTGVVNVILKDDFEGAEFNASVSGDTEGVGAGNHSFSFVAGGNFDDGKGNATFYAGIDDITEVMSNDSQYLNNASFVNNPENTGEEDGITDRIYVTGIGSEMIHGNGVINPFGGARYAFTKDGTPVEQTQRDLTNSFAFGTFPDGCQYCFFGEDYENLMPGLRKINFGSSLNYQISENVNFFADAKFVKNEIEQQFQPSFRFGNITIDVAENAFIDPGLQAELLGIGQGFAGFAKFFDEAGTRAADNTRQTFRVVAGFEGFFTVSETDVDFQTYYTFGETKNTRSTINNLILANVNAAIDSVINPDTGMADCRMNVPSAQYDGYVTPQIAGGPCVAYNPFGQQNTQEATDFSFHAATRYDTIDQEILGGFLTFDSEEMFSLPGGAISFATGFEYREETSKTVTDEFTKRGLSLSAATPDAAGGFDVTEAFIEFDAPILKDLPFVHSLTIDGAYRTADYSHVDEDITAWKVGFGYAPIEDVRIRATFGESVRAPNIDEAFRPQSPGFGRVSDPCDADNIGNDPDRAANCAALGIPADFQANDNVSVDLLSGGNPNLDPESSESTTVGLVFTPSFVENLTVTLDYFQIEITDAIAAVSAQTVVDNCVDGAGGLDAAFCSQIDRDPVTNDVSLVRSGEINMSKLTTEGYELESRYSMGLEQFDLQGDLSFRLNLTHIADYTSFEFQNKPDEINEEHGEIGIPEWQGQLTATYSLGDLAVTWSSRYLDDQALIDLTPGKDTPEDLEIWKLDAVFYHNLDVGYQLTDDLRISGGIRNLANELPHPITSNSIFDSIGRRAYANLTYRF